MGTQITKAMLKSTVDAAKGMCEIVLARKGCVAPMAFALARRDQHGKPLDEPAVLALGFPNGTERDQKLAQIRTFAERVDAEQIVFVNEGYMATDGDADIKAVITVADVRSDGERMFFVAEILRDGTDMKLSEWSLADGVGGDFMHLIPEKAKA